MGGKEMKFEEAMAIMRNGGKVRRPCWKSAYIFLAHCGKGPLCLANGMPSSKRVYFVGNVTSENIVSDDWEEVLTVGEKIAREVEAWSK
jgi:hypothetical protein